MAFLDGAPPERLCQPIVDHIKAGGGEVHMNSPLRNIKLSEDNSVECFEIGGKNFLNQNYDRYKFPIHHVHKYYFT